MTKARRKLPILSPAEARARCADAAVDVYDALMICDIIDSLSLNGTVANVEARRARSKMADALLKLREAGVPVPDGPEEP